MPSSTESSKSPIVPIQYAGKWIAWSQDGTRIIGSGQSLEEAVNAAKAAGEPKPVFAKVPKANVRFVGYANLED